MRLYFIKVSLQGVSPMVWRRLRVPEVTSLARLHDCIQIVNGWDDDHLHQFHIYGKDYGICYEGGLSYGDDAYSVHFGDFDFDVGDKFTYEYNFFRHIMHDIRIEAVKDVLSTNSNIICLSGAGMPDTSKYDVIDLELRIMQKIVDKKGILSRDDILDFQEEIERVVFIKKRINEALAAPLEK